MDRFQSDLVVEAGIVIARWKSDTETDIGAEIVLMVETRVVFAAMEQGNMIMDMNVHMNMHVYMHVHVKMKMKMKVKVKMSTHM